ncbi:A24 family peptidase [Modestobacter sp. NPDC049651]|uniref:A24 family peptidase n=1 Tax=unclassified Modestobacter TaxID=2643866 RepID=UPI00340D9B80
MTPAVPAGEVRVLLVAAAVVAGLLLGPWLATATARLAARDRSARAGRVRVAVTCLAAAAALGVVPALTAVRPALAALAWFAGAAVVLAGTDLAVHRLPDRVTGPAAVGVGAALLLDAALTGAWGALLRAVVAAGVALGLGAAGHLVSPAGLGRGDVKLLGLLGLVLGWAGWGVLLAGVFVGLLVGAGAALLLVALGRAGWRTAIPFGPPLLIGAFVALLVAAPLPT